MKLKNLMIGILAAIAAFLMGISAHATVDIALSLLPTTAALSELSEPNVTKIEPAPAAPVPAEPIFLGPSTDKETAANEPVEEFDWTGNYALYSETLPTTFADIEYLDIQTHEYDQDEDENWTSKRIAPKGSIQTKKALKLDRIAIGGGIVAFQTATVDGVSYKFTGRFFERDACSGGTPNLTGRLIKIKDNKWAAEMQAEFYVQCGC